MSITEERGQSQVYFCFNCGGAGISRLAIGKGDSPALELRACPACLAEIQKRFQLIELHSILNAEQLKKELQTRIQVNYPTYATPAIRKEFLPLGDWNASRELLSLRVKAWVGDAILSHYARAWIAGRAARPTAICNVICSNENLAAYAKDVLAESKWGGTEVEAYIYDLDERNQGAKELIEHICQWTTTRLRMPKPPD